MATRTQHLGLSKPSYSDRADISLINDDMDILDEVIGGEEPGTTSQSITGALAEINSGKADKSLIAYEYSATRGYALGEFCFHEKKLYRCNTEIPSGEEWTSYHWSVVTTTSQISAETAERKADVAALSGSMDAEYDSTATYAVGDTCVHANALYKCTTAIDTPEDWTDGHWQRVTVKQELGSAVSALNNEIASTASVLNSKIASTEATLADGIAIVANGDTHAAITSDQFVYVRSHGEADGFSGNAILNDGLYTASGNISANGELTTSNLTSDSAGGLNDLKGQVDSLNSKLVTSAESHSDWLTTEEAGDTGTMLYIQKMGKLLILNLRTAGRVHTDEDTLANLPVGYRPISNIDVPCWINGNGVGVCRIQPDGVVRTWVLHSGTASSGRVYLYAAYLIA